MGKQLLKLSSKKGCFSYTRILFFIIVGIVLSYLAISLILNQNVFTQGPQIILWSFFSLISFGTAHILFKNDPDIVFTWFENGVEIVSNKEKIVLTPKEIITISFSRCDFDNRVVPIISLKTISVNRDFNFFHRQMVIPENEFNIFRYDLESEIKKSVLPKLFASWGLKTYKVSTEKSWEGTMFCTPTITFSHQ